jgi:hypothetical protein
MLPSFVVAMLAFSVPPPPSFSRRDVLFGAASATFVPCAAFAELYGEGKAPKVAEAQSIANAKAIKFAKPMPETEAFKAAEAKRKAAETGQVAKKTEAERLADDMARLGLKSYK